MATRAKELSDLGNLKLDVTANGIDVVGTGSNFKSESYNILNIQTDTDDSGSSDDGIFKITNGAAGTTKAEFRWDESEDLVHVSYGDHGRHISIGSDGKVGIATGSTAPSQTLDVNGTTIAEQYLLDAIDKDISDTAVDVLVYDTRKDSDGGAWRKRTQHTSWYKEDLNTATRGSRKEFPSVAVITLQSGAITIYDGDDPEMPMWMKFTQSTGQSFTDGGQSSYVVGGCGFATVSGLSMLNGTLVVPHHGGCSASDSREGVLILNFISEQAEWITDDANANFSFAGPIADRSNNMRLTLKSPARNIVDSEVNHTDITVLPNAPIDSTTGLPVPTIAVACELGATLIKDDGTVSDHNSTSGAGSLTVDRIKFVKDSHGDDIVVIAFGDNTATPLYAYSVPKLLGQATWSISGDENIAQFGHNGTRDSYILNSTSNTNPSLLQGLAENKLAIGTTSGLSIVNVNDESQAYDGNEASALITSSYNTGWLTGYTSLATLSSTDDTNLSSSGNTNILAGKSWTNNTNFPYETFTTSGLDITAASNTTAYGAANLTWNSTPGTTYTAYFNLTLNSGVAPTLYCQTSSSFGNGLAYQTKDGAQSFTFTATRSGSIYFSFSVGNNDASSFAITDLELYEGGEANRSARDDIDNTSIGLAVTGTITKSAVATGAELMAYSGFTTSNYLEQQYNDQLDFNQGDFAVCFWTKNAAAGSEYILDRADANGNYRLAIYLTSGSNGSVYMYTQDGASNNSEVGGVIGTLNEWAQVWCIRKGTHHQIWVNGVNKISSSLDIRDIASANGEANLIIGTRFNKTNPNLGYISLLRMGVNVPTPEQIKKSYDDEKQLFQLNGKATLYGSSDAVTALVYDDDTELLHVGTSAGRSVFQGLARIDNTTDAVGVAIGASNGLVAEE